MPFHETAADDGDDASLDAIQPLANLPLFFKLAGREALLAGGSDGAAWKAELLASAGACVRVLAPNPSAKMREIAARREAIRIEPRRWRPEDLRGVALAILDAGDDAEARAFRDAARAAGAPVNVIDKPEFCDFSFGAILNRSPLVVGISTDGAAPVFGQAIRARLEALVPESFADWAKAAREWRTKLAALDFHQRRNFWERFADRAMASAGRGPEAADFAALAAAEAEAASPARGKIILVGAGPGDPDLLTLKAVRALQSADVILFDQLASPRILELARREARRIDVGKRGGAPSMKQADISALLVSLAQEGKTVVRLKGGDPTMFGRASEEILAARSAGVPLTIIPGVTAALAAAAELGVSLSHRDLARRVQFVTAHDAGGALPEGLEWRALVDRDATTAVYMGSRTLPAFVARLIEEGLDPKTPAAMLENVSLPGAKRHAAPISELPAKLAAAALAGPSLLIYGRALDITEGRS